MDEIEGLTYCYDPTPVPTALEAGVSSGWVVLHNGEPGEGVAFPVAWLRDGDGGGPFVQTGNGQHVTITAD